MARQYLDFEIKHQTIRRTDDLEVVGGSKGYLWARFTFCEDWAEEKIKYAIFTAGMRAFPMLIEDGICEIPWEVLQLTRFYVGVAGGELIVSAPARIDVTAGITDVWSPDLDPTPTLFYAIMKKLSGLEVITEEQITAAVKSYLEGQELVTKDKLDAAMEDIAVPGVDLTGYATEEYVDKAIENIDIPDTDLTGYATEKYVDDAIGNIDIPGTDLTGYATEEYVRKKVAEAQIEGSEVDLSDYATKEFVEAVTGGDVTPLDIQGVNWLNWFDYSDHINNYEAGKGIDSVDGSEYELAGQYLFPKIPLRGGKTYTMSGSMRVCVLYNGEDGSYISTIRGSATTQPVTFTVSDEYSEVYIRFCHNNTTYIKDTFMIVEGEILPNSFVPHEAVIPWLNISDKRIDGTQLADGSVDGTKLKTESVDGNKIINKTLSTSKLSAYLGSENLYNSALADRSLWHDANGTAPGSLSGYFASPLIPVTPGRKYYVYGAMDTATKASQYAVQTVYSAYEVNSEGVYTKISFAEDENTGKAIVYTAGPDAKYLAFNARDLYINIFAVSEKFHAYCPPYVAQLVNTQNVVQGHYAGGTLVALGDSITRGCSNGETLEDGTVLANGGQIPKPYANYAAELLGMYCKNFGVDGATIKTVLARINSTEYMAGLKAQPDIITVKIGTNDMAQVPLGTIDDVYDAANVTYYSGLKEIARLLSEGFPGSAIVFITPLRANDNARAYVKAMEEVAALYDLPCMQMHKVMRYMQQKEDGSYYINDFYNGLHPNQAAHLRMGRALAGFLQSV